MANVPCELKVLYNINITKRGGFYITNVKIVAENGAAPPSYSKFVSLQNFPLLFFFICSGFTNKNNKTITIYAGDRHF